MNPLFNLKKKKMIMLLMIFISMLTIEMLQNINILLENVNDGLDYYKVPKALIEYLRKIQKLYKKISRI